MGARYAGVMTSDADDALTWEGDDDRPTQKPAAEPEQKAALPRGWNAIGKRSETVGRIREDGTILDPADKPPLSTPMLLLLGIVGGIYLLYTVGWIIGGLTLQSSAMFLIPDVMYQVALWAAVLAPALWFCAVWVLTRASATWVRVVGLLGGVLLLVPWPFVMTGAVGA
ncbi:hypothetical protein GCM10007269_23480 [Microbacterium murale]|uniref:DNA polymerase III subunit gamma/tau n=2 Tax=Microbacterium murale TaxID=1081040 RepID=A0ABQ1RSQ1_9MICO|nr:hypothetical protein GCM10007269_23480 [Microbacterium murale]